MKVLYHEEELQYTIQLQLVQYSGGIQNGNTTETVALTDTTLG